MQLDKTYYLNKNSALHSETLKEFALNSFDQSSLNAIIKNSNFNKGSFYYRYNDKIDLYIALFYDIIVKQYEYIDKLMKVTLDDSTLLDCLSLLFESQYDLYLENPLYISFLRNFSMELDSFKEEVIKHSQQPFIDYFLSLLSSYLSDNENITHDESKLIICHIKLSYFHFDELISSSSPRNFIRDISDFLYAGINIYINGPDSTLQTNIGSKFTPFQNSSSFHEIFSSKNDIICIIGPKSSGKSAFLSQLITKESSSFITQSLQIRFDKSVQWNIKKVTNNLNSNAYIDIFLSKMNLVGQKKMKIKDLSSSRRKIIELFLKYLHYPQVIVIDDLFDSLVDTEKKLIIDYLIEWKNTGSSIVLSSRHIQDVSSFSDRIGFLVSGSLVNIKSVYELHKKYGKITHIVKYLDNNSIKIAAFSNDSFNSDYFKKIIDHHTILSLETKTNLPDEVFKLETGVKLG